MEQVVEQAWAQLGALGLFAISGWVVAYFERKRANALQEELNAQSKRHEEQFGRVHEELRRALQGNTEAISTLTEVVRDVKASIR